MILNNYRYIQLDYILELQHIYNFCIMYLSIIYFTYQYANGTQFLNITPLFLLSARFTA